MITDEQVYKIGVITRTHGKTGEVQCHALNSAWEDSDAEFVILRLDNILTPFRVTDWRTKGAEDILMTLRFVDTEEQAQPLIGAEAYMLRRDIVAADDGDAIAWSDLQGWTLVDDEAGELGIITAVDETTANTLISVHSADSANDRLLPLHEDFITSLDADAKTIRVNLPFHL